MFLQDSLPLPSKWDNEESHMEREQDPDTISHVMNYIRQQHNLSEASKILSSSCSLMLLCGAKLCEIAHTRVSVLLFL